MQSQSRLDHQASPQVSNHIFVNNAGDPLKIFVEPSEVTNRPKLLRTLRSAGGQVCNDVGEAEIVLVTPATVSATQLIASWPAEKVFLDTNWVYESIRRRRPYLQNENWGGFALSQGTTGEVVPPENHLPTPRETPSETHAPQAESAMQNQPQPQSQQQSQFVPAPPLVSPGLQQQQPSFSQPMVNGQSFPAMSMIVQTPNGPQVISPTPQMLAQMLGSLMQQGINTGVQLGQPPNQMLQGQPFFPQQMQQGYMVPQYAPAPMPMSQQSVSLPPGMYFQVAPAQQPEGAGSPVHQGQPHNSVSPESSAQARASGTPMDRDDTPQRKRKARLSEPSSAKKVKTEGGHKSKRRRHSEGYVEEQPLPFTSSSSSTTPARVSTNHKKLFMKSRKEPYKIFLQLEVPHRQRYADPIKKHGGKLIADIADADVVVLAHPSQKNFEGWFRQANYFDKPAVKPQWVTDCVEQNKIIDLDDYVYTNLTVQKKRGRPFSSGQRYVVVTKADLAQHQDAEDEDEDQPADQEGGDEDDDNDEESEEDDDEVAAKEEKRRKKRLQEKSLERASKKEKTVKEKQVKKEKVATKSSRVKEDAGSAKRGVKAKGAKEKANTIERSPEPHGPNWAPSPPPPTRVVEHHQGKNRYTEEDMDYCDEYTAILLARDPTMTVAAIAQKMHAKMPHHTARSWNARMAYPEQREKTEKMRRRAEIQFRKAAGNARRSVSEARQIAGPSHSEATPMAVDEPPLPADTTNTTNTDAFDTMVRFFAAGRADNLADTEVWHVLAREHPHLSAEAWEAFWSEHSVSIGEEVKRLNDLGEPKAEPE